MIPVNCHHLQLKSRQKFKTVEEMMINLDSMLTALFNLSSDKFKPKSASTNYVKQYEQIYTFRGEIDFNFSNYDNGNCTLLSITVHGAFWERLGRNYNYETILQTANTLNLQPRELHFKCRIPATLADFQTFDNHFKEESYTTKSTVFKCSSDSKTWSIGKRSTQGSRISFYDAAARHEEATAGDTDIELQLYGKSAIVSFLQAIKTTDSSLEAVFFNTLFSRITFKDLNDTDLNMSRKKTADFWLKIQETFNKIEIPKRTSKEPKLERKIAVTKGRMYSNLLSATPHIWMNSLEQFLEDQELLEPFVHRCLEKLQLQHLRF